MDFSPFIHCWIRIVSVALSVPVSYTHLDVYKRQRQKDSSFVEKETPILWIPLLTEPEEPIQEANAEAFLLKMILKKN